MSASTRNRPWAFDAELIKRNLSELKSVYHPGVRNSEVKIQEEIEAAHRKSSERCKMRITLLNEHQVCWEGRQDKYRQGQDNRKRVHQKGRTRLKKSPLCVSITCEVLGKLNHLSLTHKPVLCAQNFNIPMSPDNSILE